MKPDRAQDIPMRRNSRPARWPWVFAALVLVGGAALSLYAWRALRRIEIQAIEDEFRAQAESLAQRIAREVKMFEDVLDSISHLHTLSDRISPEDFAEFVEKGMRFHRDVLGAFGFVQQINEEARLLLETAETNELRIVRRDETNAERFVGVPRRGVYYPLMYQYPEGALGLPLGFDFGSDPTYGPSVERMLRTGRPVVGGAAPQSEPGERLLLFAPIVYMILSDADRQPLGRSVVGFTAGLFSPRAVVDRALGADRALLEQGGWRVEWGMGEGARETGDRNGAAARLVYDAVIQVADMPWSVRLSADRESFLPAGRRLSLVVLIVGLGLTAVIGGELFMLAGRSRRIEKVVALRTAALREAKEQLEKEMRRRGELEEEILKISSREKVRVGQDLHDSLGQKLTGAVLLSGAVARRSPEEIRADVQALHDLLKESVAQVRRMAKGLAPVELGERGLAGALEQLVEETQEAADGISCEFRCAAPMPVITGKVAEHLYHIAQEAVTNALRHANAREIEVALRVDGGFGELVISDDGAGLDARASRGNGLGLEIMRHRAHLIGGDLDVESAHGQGTKIICRFPIVDGW